VSLRERHFPTGKKRSQTTQRKKPLHRFREPIKKRFVSNQGKGNNRPWLGTRPFQLKKNRLTPPLDGCIKLNEGWFATRSKISRTETAEAPQEVVLGAEALSTGKTTKSHLCFPQRRKLTKRDHQATHQCLDKFENCGCHQC